MARQTRPRTTAWLRLVLPLALAAGCLTLAACDDTPPMLQPVAPVPSITDGGG